ncbi:unnamed protein product [Pedinophyceae sp. YPF-701]|nr:unnamed protein product [Pedinophyceae sp. YPF-701]
MNAALAHGAAIRCCHGQSSARASLAAAMRPPARRCGAGMRAMRTRASFLAADVRERARISAPAPQRSVRARAGSVASDFDSGVMEPEANEMLRWLIEDKQGPAQAVEPRAQEEIFGNRLAMVVTRDVPAGGVVVEIPGDLCATSTDVSNTPGGVAEAAAGRSELIGLALWLQRERALLARGESSPWAPMVAALPQATLSPLLWSEAEVDELLAGSPVRKECKDRVVTLRREWDALAPSLEDETATFDGFLEAFCVVVATATYLPSAGCFAMVPLLTHVRRSPATGAADVDYDVENGCVVAVAESPLRGGEELRLSDPRPNSELLLATGRIEEPNPADCIIYRSSLVAADRMFELKRQVVEASGLSADNQEFPLFADRMPNQLLSYLRLSRVQDPAELAKISFEQDALVSQMNEYEVLQLLMADLRDMISAYKTEVEEDVKLLQRRDATPRELVACRLRLLENAVLRGSMDGVRRKLAPIRGIPTKDGRMEDPNADLLEIFETLEKIPQVPGQLVKGLVSWARGDDDPEWKEKISGGKGGKKGAPASPFEGGGAKPAPGRKKSKYDPSNFR